MGATYRVNSLRELASLIHSHNVSREKRVKKAIVKAARQGRNYIIKFTLPIAFRELEHSLRVESKGGKVRIVADAPHAAPVETGSRPHWPPLAPLIAWVKLRGMQGQEHAGSGKNSARRQRGTTTAEHSHEIALVLNVLAMQRGGSNDVDDPVAIARAIQHAIAMRGTKPHWYMRKALPEIRKFLDVEIRIALNDAGQGTGISAGMRSAPGERMGAGSAAGDMAAE